MKRIKVILNIASATLLFLIVLRFCYLVYLSSGLFQFSYSANYENLKRVYLHSQYILQNPSAWIPDEALYSYAAGAYLKGESLLDVNPGTPPLGKYLFSISILLFDNPNVIIIFCFVLLLIGIFMVSKEALGWTTISLFVILAVLFEPMFTDQLRYMPLLDIPMMMFQIWSVYFFIISIVQNKPYNMLIAFTLIGLAMMTKIFSISVPLLMIYTLYILWKKRSWFIYIGLGYALVLLIAVLTYVSIYFEGYTPWKMLGVQKWSYLYNTSKLNRFFTVWDLVFFNRWHVWWGNQEVIRDTNWNISWPVTFGLSIAWLFSHIRSFFKISIAKQLLYAWIIVYFIMISLNQATARYLLPILSFVYIVSFDLLYDAIRYVYSRTIHKKNKQL